jgi:hypothetical protein
MTWGRRGDYVQNVFCFYTVTKVTEVDLAQYSIGPFSDRK